MKLTGDDLVVEIPALAPPAVRIGLLVVDDAGTAFRISTAAVIAVLNAMAEAAPHRIYRPAHFAPIRLFFASYSTFRTHGNLPLVLH